jgi:hypothetical protein
MKIMKVLECRLTNLILLQILLTSLYTPKDLIFADTTDERLNENQYADINFVGSVCSWYGTVEMQHVYVSPNWQNLYKFAR